MKTLEKLLQVKEMTIQLVAKEPAKEEAKLDFSQKPVKVL